MLPIAHYFTTENASGLQIVGDYTLQDNAKGCVVLQHGFSAYRAEPQMQALRLASLVAGFNVVQFDTTHSFGASGGALEHCTAFTAYADLCAVMAWAKLQLFAPQKFILGGSSLGGLCVGHYAEQNPNDVCGLMLFSAVISGQLNHAQHLQHNTADFLALKANGFANKTHRYNPKISGKVAWAFRESLLDFDLLVQANNIVCPVLLAVGSADTSTPLAHQQLMAQALAKTLGDKAQLCVINDAPHTIVEMDQLQQLHDTAQAWLKQL